MKIELFSINDIKNAIEKEGYIDEQKSIIEFQKQGFFASGNYAFEDQDSKISREVDIIASKYTEFYDHNAIFVLLSYAEVKKRSNPIVFFERNIIPNESIDSFIPMLATKTFFNNIEPKLSLSKILNVENNHHQAKHNSLSTQFCEVYEVIKNNNQKEKFIEAGHEKSYEKLILPLLKCVDAEINNMGKYVSTFDLKTKRFVFYLFQPIIIISGPLYSYNLHDDNITEKDYVIYRRHHNSSSVKRSILIDVVKKDSLSKYISDKLAKTYTALENSFKENIDLIIQHSINDENIINKKIDVFSKKQGQI